MTTHTTEFHLTIAGVTDREAEDIYTAIMDLLYGNAVVESGYVHTDLIEGTDEDRSQTQLAQLTTHCEDLLRYRDRIGPLGFQLEKLDDHLWDIRQAIKDYRKDDANEENTV